MSKPILPKNIREKVSDLFQNDHSTVEIFDLILDDAKDYVDSHEQLSRCITSIVRKRTAKIKGEINEPKGRCVVPLPKRFDSTKYSDVISQLSETMQEKEFEKSCNEIVTEILTNQEGFDSLEDANMASGFTNPPFDFLGFKNSEPYLIEFKGSLKSFNAPGETQKRRLKELLKRIEGLNVALLQVKLRTGEYRMLYNEEMNLFFDGRKMPVEPIAKWIRARIKGREA